MPEAPLLTIDGSHGEGGGQILRTSLSLAAITGRAVEIIDIRAGRTPPGLKAQHVAAVRAAGAICAAMTEDAEIGSARLRFTPGAPVQPGAYHFDVGTAGAAPLVLQTVLLPLALANSDANEISTVRISGGTHVPHSPTAEYLAEIYLPVLRSLGVAAEFEMHSAGYFPRGGGLLTATIAPNQTLSPIAAAEARGKLEEIEATITASSLPEHVTERAIAALTEHLAKSNIARSKLAFRESAPTSVQPGAAVLLAARSGNELPAGFSAIGERGKPMERVALAACEPLLRWHKEGVARCDEHLADQLVLPAALTPGNHAWTTSHATEHLSTALWTVQQFFPTLTYEITPTKSGGALVEVARS